MVNIFNEESMSRKNEKSDDVKTSTAEQLFEVEPELPTYYIFWNSVAKVMKFLYSPEGCRPKYCIVQHVGWDCNMWSIDREKDDFFTTLPFHPNIASDYGIAILFLRNDFDIESTLNELAVWGIDKIYIRPHYDKTLDVRTFLERIKDIAAKSYSDIYDAIKDIFWKKDDDEKLKIFGF